MLLSVMNAKKTLIAAIAAASVATVPAAPAFALSEKDKAFAAGVATAVIVDEILKNRRKARLYDQGHTSTPVYVAPPAYREPVYRAPTTTTSIYATPAARVFQTYSVSERKAIQRNLRAWGYYRGGIDGVFGPGTYNAITAYARDEGTSASLRTTSGAYGVYDGLLF